MKTSLFWTVFITVFLAELGDKTQLVAMTATARSGSLFTVFLAASLALVCATAIGVAIGDLVFKTVPAHTLKYIAGTVFIAVGLWVIVKG